MKSADIYIHHFSVMAPTDIIERTMQFYRDVLGLKLGPRPNFNFPGYWLYAGDAPIIHLIAKDDRPQGAPGYLHHIALRCHDLDATIEQLSKANIEYRRQNLDDVQQIQLTLMDPAGNLVELNFVNRRNA